MCGRYYVDPDDDGELKLIIEKINENFRNTTDIPILKTGEIFPTDTAPVITNEATTPMKWGFSCYDGKGKVINARLETVHEKAMFRPSYNEFRCLIPASHYFEWEKRGAKKQKMEIGMKSPIYMAGLYRYERDSAIQVFVILTRPAWKQIGFIHDRMPVILYGEAQKHWLNYTIGSAEIMQLPESELYYKDS